MTLEGFLNLSYSLVLLSDILLDEKNVSETCLLIKKALNLLKSILIAIQALLNLTTALAEDALKLQVVFDKYNRIFLC